jgi:hypothetical protein
MLGVGCGANNPTPGKIYVQKTSEIPWPGLKNRRLGCKEKELIFGTQLLGIR